MLTDGMSSQVLYGSERNGAGSQPGTLPAELQQMLSSTREAFAAPQPTASASAPGRLDLVEASRAQIVSLLREQAQQDVGSGSHTGELQTLIFAHLLLVFGLLMHLVHCCIALRVW